MLDFVLPAVGATLLAFLDEEQQFRVLLLCVGLMVCVSLLSIRDSLDEIAALGYEIRNLRAYIRPRKDVPVAPSGSSAGATPPVADTPAESSVQPATEGTE